MVDDHRLDRLGPAPPFEIPQERQPFIELIAGPGRAIMDSLAANDVPVGVVPKCHLQRSEIVMGGQKIVVEKGNDVRPAESLFERLVALRAEATLAEHMGKLETLRRIRPRVAFIRRRDDHLIRRPVLFLQQRQQPRKQVASANGCYDDDQSHRRQLVVAIMAMLLAPFPFRLQRRAAFERFALTRRDIRCKEQDRQENPGGTLLRISGNAMIGRDQWRQPTAGE
jgi:hypothetical protein